MEVEGASFDPSTLKSRIIQSASLAKLNENEDDMDVDGEISAENMPKFSKISALEAKGGKKEFRRIRCPPHRLTPLRDSWEQLLTPLVEYLKLQVL